jgi:hypothetical protein
LGILAVIALNDKLSAAEADAKNTAWPFRHAASTSFQVLLDRRVAVGEDNVRQ